MSFIYLYIHIIILYSYCRKSKFLAVLLNTMCIIITYLIVYCQGQHLPHPFGLDLYGDEVFWTDWDTQSIQAANKQTGKGRRTLGAGVAGLMDVRVFHKDRVGGVNRCVSLANLLPLLYLIGNVNINS